MLPAGQIEALYVLRSDSHAVDTSDLTRMAESVRRYAGFPLGAADASVVAVAERLKTARIVTLDHRHFRAVRPAHCDATGPRTLLTITGAPGDTISGTGRQ